MTRQTVNASRAEPRTRTILQADGVPLSLRLLPGDEVVIVERALAPSSFGPDSKLTAEQALDFAVSHTQAVAIVEAQESISKLAEEDTWIYTYTSGVIRDVIASPSSLPLRIGGRVVLRSDGGDVIIGGKTLRVRPGTAPYRAQHRYLVFFSVGSEDASLAVPLASLEVTVPGHWGVCL